MNGKEIMEKKHLLLTIEYDGTCFSGWQRQPGRRTVQGELERVLSVLCKNFSILPKQSRFLKPFTVLIIWRRSSP